MKKILNFFDKFLQAVLVFCLSGMFLARCGSAKLYEQEAEFKAGRKLATAYTGANGGENGMNGLHSSYCYVIHAKDGAKDIPGVTNIPGVVQCKKADRYSYVVIISPVFDQKKTLKKVIRNLPK